MEELPTAVIAIRKLNKTTGAARIALQQISILNQMGYRVKVICEEANKKAISSHGGDLKVITKFPFNSFIRRLWFSNRVNAWCQRHKPSLIISHGDVENSDIIYMHNCVDLAQELIHPNVVIKQSDVSKMHHKILKESSFQHIVANSQLMANDLITRYSIPKHKVSISYPGFDEQQFNADIQKGFRKKQREKLGVTDQVKLIGLITSGDFKKRNLDLFIDIAHQLNENAATNYHFLVIGQGDVTHYQEKTIRLNIDKNFTWKKTVPNVEHYYAALDLFILPAHIEEFGCVVLEAMACSTPTLISERVGAGELFQGDLKKLIINGYEPRQWATFIENFINVDNTDIRKQLVDTASRYTYEYQYKALKKLIFQKSKNVKDDTCPSRLRK